MTDLDPMAVDVSRGWGVDQSTADLIAFGAAVAPESAALEGKGGPVTFAQLNAQVVAIGGVLAAQGLGPDAAVGASISAHLDTKGASPEAVAAATRQAVDQIRAAAFTAAGSVDLGSLSGIVRSTVYRFADRVAVTDMDGTSLTYAELDAQSTAVAAGLIEAGAGPERLVGVALDRDAELIVALVGIVKAGAAYLPLDRSHPVERLRSIVDDAKPQVVLVDGDTAAKWTDLDVPMSSVSEVRDRGRNSDAPLPENVNPAHPAYVMYTSGSTGKPKGVVVTNGDVVTLLSAMGREYDYSPNDVWTMFQSYAFDVSVGEIWVSIAFGGRLVVLDHYTTRSPGDFVEVLERERVTVVNLTPSAFYQLAGAVRPPAQGRLSQSVRSMIFVGEALDFEQVRRWHADRRQLDGNDGPELNNMYGPTEATVYMTRRVLTPEFVAATFASDVGMPLAGTDTYVLDSRLARVPEGVPGDLYIAGPQLARGYSGRFALNATRFVADPFGSAGQRMYQTGDVAIVRNGSIEFLGRADDQIKLRGFRIELGEVEAALLSAAGVNAAAAAVYELEGHPAQLVGYVVGAAADGGELDVAAVKAAAKDRVPEYMVPDVIMTMDQLPLNVNGKLDRKALPAPVITSRAEYEAPATEAEIAIAEVIGQVLGLERISATESIFELGGNSLSAAQISARCAEDLGLDVAVRDVFEAPTVRDLATRVTGRSLVERPELVAAERPAEVPLSYAQRRIWFLQELAPTSTVYHIP
ncbi:MAG: amino acid adenylation domain-containing protein, partial [Rhodococcus sp.]|nr:amino acid adenylation domain-containing protein [Rhodococcus sp. (in: high G+C Gram-positive bacteria)]